MTCSTHFNIRGKGSIDQLWNVVGRLLFSKYVHHTLIYTNSEQCYTWGIFVSCSIVFIFVFGGSISQLWNIVGS